MAWQPDKVCGGNEHIGRRLFDEPMLVGAQEQKSYGGLLLRHFEETRSDEFSVDRLGKSSIDRSVVRTVKPLADEAGSRFQPSKPFHGWIVLTAQKLTSPMKGTALPLIASPDDETKNLYHAHLDTRKLLESEPEAIRHYHIAMHLKELFTRKGHQVYQVPIQTGNESNEGIMQSVSKRIGRSLSTVFSHCRRLLRADRSQV